MREEKSGDDIGMRKMEIWRTELDRALSAFPKRVEGEILDLDESGAQLLRLTGYKIYLACSSTADNETFSPAGKSAGSPIKLFVKRDASRDRSLAN